MGRLGFVSLCNWEGFVCMCVFRSESLSALILMCFFVLRFASSFNRRRLLCNVFFLCWIRIKCLINIWLKFFWHLSYYSNPVIPGIYFWYKFKYIRCSFGCSHRTLHFRPRLAPETNCVFEKNFITEFSFNAEPTSEWPSVALVLSFLFHIYFRPFSSAFSSHLPLQANTRPKYSSFLFLVPSTAFPLAWVIGVHFSSSYFSRHDRLMTFPLLLHFLPVFPVVPHFFIARGLCAASGMRK